MFSTLNQIKKFQNLNDIFINVYPKEEQKEILSLQLPRKRGKHVNLLYVQDSCNDNTKHFAWIKDLFLLMNIQINKYGEIHKKYFCDVFNCMYLIENIFL